MKVHYIQDSDINNQLDQQLLQLLSTCFPSSPCFQSRRYNKEPPSHRWYISDSSSGVIAHIGLHEKVIICQDQESPVGGISEVCVHPDFRGQGLAMQLLTTIHNWLHTQKFPFSLLFGEASVYGSIGYKSVNNLYAPTESIHEVPKKQPSAMVYSLSKNSWPREDVYLKGLSF